MRVIEIPQAQLISRAKSSYASSEKSEKKQGILSKLFNSTRQRLGIFNACRMPDFADLWIKPALHALDQTEPYDVVVSTAGPYSVHIFAYLLKKRGGVKKWIADYRDTWSDNYFYPGLFPINLLEKLVERKILQYADTITTVSDSFTATFKNKYQRQSVETIPNGFDPEDLKSIEESPTFPADNKFRIVHTGSIYLGRRDPSPLFQAIAEMSQTHPNILDSLEVIFVGSNQAKVQSLIEEYNVKKWVKISGFVAREQALALQRDANALLFLPWNDPNVDGIITGKIFEYLYSKTPIICVGASHMEQSQKMILDARAGQSFHSVEQIKRYLNEQLQNPKQIESSVDDAFLNQYNRTVIARNMLELLKS